MHVSVPNQSNQSFGGFSCSANNIIKVLHLEPEGVAYISHEGVAYISHEGVAYISHGCVAYISHEGVAYNQS